MSDEPKFEDGAFVWFWPKLESGPVVARVIHAKGSGYHVAWASLGGNLFDYVADPDELFAVPPPPSVMKSPLLPPEAVLPPAPELRETQPLHPAHPLPESHGHGRRRK